MRKVIQTIKTKIKNITANLTKEPHRIAIFTRNILLRLMEIIKENEIFRFIYLSDFLIFINY